MASRLLERTQVVPCPRGEVFTFFADAHNLEAITPQFLRFSVVIFDHRRQQIAGRFG